MKTLIVLTLLTLICLLHGPQTPVTASRAVGLSKECCAAILNGNIKPARVRTMIEEEKCHKKVFVVTTVCDKTLCLKRHSEKAKQLWMNYERYTLDKTTAPVQFNVSHC